MRNITIKKGKRTSFPWGPASSVNGAKYVPAAIVFIDEGRTYGQTFDIDQLRIKAEQVAPEWFAKDPELMAGDAARRLNEGGANAQLGQNKFFLQWFPQQRVWQVLDAGDKYDRTDAAETLGHAASNIRQTVIRVYQMATHLIEDMDEEQQEAHVAEFNRVMGELDVIEDWGKHKLLTLQNSVAKAQNPALANIGLAQLKK
jgi:hypothetical protein